LAAGRLGRVFPRAAESGRGASPGPRRVSPLESRRSVGARRRLDRSRRVSARAPGRRANRPAAPGHRPGRLGRLADGHRANCRGGRRGGPQGRSRRLAGPNQVRSAVCQPFVARTKRVAGTLCSRVGTFTTRRVGPRSVEEQ